MDCGFQLFWREIWFDLGEETELEKTGLDNGTDLFIEFEGAVEDDAEVFCGCMNVGLKSVRGIEGWGQVFVEDDYFSFTFIEGEKIGVHPGFNVL